MYVCYLYCDILMSDSTSRIIIARMGVAVGDVLADLFSVIGDVEDSEGTLLEYALILPMN